MKRLTLVWVIVIGVVLSTLSLAIILLGLCVPVNKQITVDQAAQAASEQDGGTLEKVNEAKRALNAAKVTALNTRKVWQADDLRYMPRYDVSDRKIAWEQLQQELSYKLGPMIEDWVASQPIKTTLAVRIPPPPTNPNDINASPKPIPLGNVTVHGSFRQILANIAHWNDFKRLVLTNGLTLSGHSPFMQGSYSAEVIIFPQNPDNLGKTIEQAGTGGGFGGFGGGAGGYSGGIPAGINIPGR